MHVREYPGMDKGQIYDGISRFVARSFRDAHQVIQLDDRGRGTMIVKGILPTDESYSPFGGAQLWVKSTLTIDVRDGRARYSYDNVEAYSKDSRLPGWDSASKFQRAAERAFVLLEADIEKSLTAKTDNW